ncbi:hypothetical protein Bpfe_030420 [Biomphalaria pfeifferi]|uniref:Uncharacterized protein n=1 Tax=Biomphalaria pfeifferi TaxID=112525 RepID=A0AAD8EUX6_BIOPF|nr:hypothetical protein Bpfe_030420 [Biomphalaria pfeifferi]
MLTTLSRGYKAFKKLTFIGVTLGLLLTQSPHSVEAASFHARTRDQLTDAVKTPDSNLKLTKQEDDTHGGSAFPPLQSHMVKRYPIGSDLELLANMIVGIKKEHNRQEVMDMLEEIGK